MRRRSREFFSVRPRYAGGSPAQVPPNIALQVAQDEKRAHARTLEGFHGEAERLRAVALGLGHVVEFLVERPQGWDVVDVLTREAFRRPFSWKKGQRCEFFDPEKGWRRGVVVEKVAAPGARVPVRPDADHETWRPPLEVERSLLRDSQSVRTLDEGEMPWA